jgi:hypothetical protein
VVEKGFDATGIGGVGTNDDCIGAPITEDCIGGMTLTDRGDMTVLTGIGGVEAYDVYAC